MLDFGFYNMDCMEGMKQFPDNYFDLAIVDPPYGDGGAHGSDKTRAGSEGSSTSIARAGFHGKSYPMGEANQIRTAVRQVQARQKNHFVGCCPEAGIFR